MASEIDAKSTSGVFAQLEQPTPERHAVAEQPGLEAPNTHSQPCLRPLFVERAKPISERLGSSKGSVAEDSYLQASVAFKLRSCKSR
jgi:hypothetical protein